MKFAGKRTKRAHRFRPWALAVASAVAVVMCWHALYTENPPGLSSPSIPSSLALQTMLWNATTSIPKKIHQCWKSKDLPEYAVPNTRTWQDLNPGYEYTLWTDDTMLHFVRDRFPQFLPAYKASRAVEKADLFRYLVVFDQGGYYSDLDVVLVAPLETWSTKYPGVKHFVGLEVATGERPDWDRWWARKFQMAQWTLASVPGHPVLQEVLTLILKQWKKHGESLFGNLSANVMESTGPGIWSDAVASVLHSRGITLGKPPYTAQMVETTGVRSDEMLVLPKAGFGLPDMVPSEDNTLVKHQFVGSWKTEGSRIPPMGFYEAADGGGWDPPFAHFPNETIKICGDRCLDTFECKAYEVKEAGACALYAETSGRLSKREGSKTFIHRGLTHDAYTKVVHEDFEEFEGMHGTLMACEGQCETDSLCLGYSTTSRGGCTVHYDNITDNAPSKSLIMRKDYMTPRGYFRRRLGGYWANPGPAMLASSPADCASYCDNDPQCIAFEIHVGDKNCYTFRELLYPFNPDWYCKTFMKRATSRNRTEQSRNFKP